VSRMAASPEIYFEHDPWRTPLFCVDAPARRACRRHRGLRSLLQAPAPHVGQRRSGEAIVQPWSVPASARDETQSQGVLAIPIERPLAIAASSAGQKKPDAIDIPDKKHQKHITKPSQLKRETREPEPQPTTRFLSVKEGRHTRSAHRRAKVQCPSPRQEISAAASAITCAGSATKSFRNWLKYEVDPTVSEGRRVYVSFDIGRAASPRI